MVILSKTKVMTSSRRESKEHLLQALLQKIHVRNCECRDSNLGFLGEWCEHYLCALPRAILTVMKISVENSSDNFFFQMGLSWPFWILFFLFLGTFLKLQLIDLTSVNDDRIQEKRSKCMHCSNTCF